MAQLQIDVSVTNGSAEVTIPGALVAADIDEGDLFKVYSQNGGQGIYHVGSVSESGGDTVVTLTAPYQGATATGVTGIFHRDFTAEQGYPLMSDGDLDAAAILSRMAAEVDDDFQGVLYDSVLAQNGGTVPEVDQSVDQTGTFTFSNTENGDRFLRFRFPHQGDVNPWDVYRFDGDGSAPLHPEAPDIGGLLWATSGGGFADHGIAFGRRSNESSNDANILIAPFRGSLFGSPSGGSQGSGTLNAEELYENGRAVAPGLIVESGSNSSGHYIRWENGEQVCWAVFEFSEAEEGSDTSALTRDLPADFVNNSSIFGYSLATDISSNLEGSSVGGYGAGGTSQHNSSFRFRAFVPNIGSDSLYWVCATAWGLWK